MILPKAVLVLAGGGFALFGFAFLFWPEPMAALVSLEISAATARTDVRAIYGGLEIGIGFFLLACSTREASIFPGLIAAVLTYGGIALGRVVGVALDESLDEVTMVALAVEIAMTVLAVIGLTRLRPAD